MEIFFTDTFLSLNLENVKNQIADKGYFIIENAVTPGFLKAIEHDFDTAIGLNSTSFNPFYTKVQKNQYYALATSKKYFNYLTHSKIFDISKICLGETFALYNNRYYESYYGATTPWHTDNKDNETATDTLGIVFLMYIVDTFDGETTFVSGSHKWSDEKYYSDQDIHDSHSEEVIQLKRSAGTLLIYDTRLIHKASLIKAKDTIRKTIFFRVDAGVGKGQINIINSAFLKNCDERLRQYLNFGYDPTQTLPKHTFPLIVQKKYLKELLSATSAYLRLRLKKLPSEAIFYVRKQLSPWKKKMLKLFT